jgi:hypothetical protein
MNAAGSEHLRGHTMSNHPSITYELAIAHDRDLIAEAAGKRLVAADRSVGFPRTALAGLGSLLIAAGARLGGIRPTGPRDLAGAAR